MRMARGVRTAVQSNFDPPPYPSKKASVCKFSDRNLQLLHDLLNTNIYLFALRSRSPRRPFPEHSPNVLRRIADHNVTRR